MGKDVFLTAEKTLQIEFFFGYVVIFLFVCHLNGVCKKKKTRRKPEIRKIDAAKHYIFLDILKQKFLYIVRKNHNRALKKS